MCSCKGWLERYNRSKDGLNHFINVMLSRILPQMIMKQVLEFLDVIPRPDEVHSICNCRGAYVHQVPL